MSPDAELCQCGHPRSVHRGAMIGACFGCILPDGNTKCWGFRAKTKPLPVQAAGLSQPMAWFGPSWGAAVNRLPSVHSPGILCQQCEGAFKPEDQGIWMRRYDGGSGPAAWHLRCFLTSMGGEIVATELIVPRSMYDNLHAAFIAAETEVGRLYELRTKLLGLIAECARASPEMAEGIIAKADIILSDSAVGGERREA